MTGRKDLFQQAMSQGHSAAWDQQWERAAGFYRQALEEFPEDSQTLLSYGLALFELGDHAQALQVYARAARANPEDPIPAEKIAQLHELQNEVDKACEAAMAAADLFLKKGDAQKAIENWSRVTRLKPENLVAHSRLALMHERLARKPQAVTEFLSVASLLQHAGKVAEARQAIDHALALVPGHNEARQALMMLETNQPLPKPVRPAAAAGLAEIPKVPQLAPPPPREDDLGLDPVTGARKKALADLANMLFELSDEEADQPSRRGLRELTQGLSLSADRSERAKLIYHLRNAVDYQMQERLEEAAGEFEAVIAMGLDLPSARYCLGEAYAHQDRLDEAAQQLQRSVNHQDYAIGARLLMGKVFQEKGRLKEAAVEYLEALKIADSQIVPPEQSERMRQLYEPLIEAHVQEADDERHEKLCENIADLLLHPDWRDRLSQARRDLPTPAPEAPPIPLAEIITQARSSQIVEALTSIHQHARSGHLRLAMEEAFRALDYAPTYLPLHSLMGDLLIQLGQTEEAIAKFVTVATAYSARGEAARAIDLFRRTVQLAPMDIPGRQRLIHHLLLSGDVEGALREYIELADVHLRLAELDNARATFGKALALAQQSRVNSSWSAALMHQIADLDLQRLDWRQAMSTFERLRKLDPDDEKARLNLIGLNLRMGQESRAVAELDNYLTHLQTQGQNEKILEVLEKLVESNPEATLFRQRLARLYQGVGRTADAIEQWDKVGDSLLDAGDQQGAIAAIQAIIHMNPPNVAEYRRILESLGG